MEFPKWKINEMLSQSWNPQNVFVESAKDRASLFVGTVGEYCQEASKTVFTNLGNTPRRLTKLTSSLLLEKSCLDDWYSRITK
jgi:hypothetical protein